MIRGFFYGMLSGAAFLVGLIWAATFNSPLIIFFAVLTVPGTVIDQILIGSPLRARSDIWFWVGTIAFYALVGVGVGRLLRTRPAKPGYCPKCSYNLTGNTSGVCPECGTKVKYT